MTAPADPLEPAEAADLSALLSTLEDWLLHTDDGVHDDLARFACQRAYWPRAAVAELIADLGGYAVRLRRLAAGEPR